MNRLEDTTMLSNIASTGLSNIHDIDLINFDEKRNKLKIVLLLKLQHRRLLREYLKDRESERVILYKEILSRLDDAIKDNNEIGIKQAYDCIYKIYCFDISNCKNIQAYLDSPYIDLKDCNQ